MVYEYPARYRNLQYYNAGICLLFGALVGGLALFGSPANAPDALTAVLGVAFSAAGAYANGARARAYADRVEISQTGVRLLHPGGSVTTMQWDEITAISSSTWNKATKLQTPTSTVVVYWRLDHHDAFAKAVAHARPDLAPSEWPRSWRIGAPPNQRL